MKIFLSVFLLITVVIGKARYTNNNYSLMFYNVENLFDTIDTQNKNDEEFLPSGDKYWDNYRYWKKIHKTFQVIAAAGGNEPPDIIGLCEVESFLPLYNLVYNTHLSKFPFQIIHEDSQDKRGIDVAIIFRKDKVQLIDYQYHSVVFPWDTSLKTRDVLLASFKVEEDTLFTFINHWPSRRGGQIKSEPKRLEAAKVVYSAIDSIQRIHSNAKIVVMGDFNDEPENKSLKLLSEKSQLVNLSEGLEESCNCGTYKYKSEWNMLDQVLVSGSLLNSKGLTIPENGLSILDNAFLLQEDNTYGGQKPFRTYLGPRYKGGYSDHLPILLNIQYTRQ